MPGRVILLRCQAVPLHRLCLIPGHAVAAVTAAADVVLRLRKALLRRQAIPLRRLRLVLGRAFAEGTAKAEDAKAHAVIHQGVVLVDHTLREKGHKSPDFLGRPVPVFLGEGVLREAAPPEIYTLFSNCADALHSFHMSLDALEAALFSPAAVAVHNYAYVLGNDHLAGIADVLAPEKLRAEGVDET